MNSLISMVMLLMLINQPAMAESPAAVAAAVSAAVPSTVPPAVTSVPVLNFSVVSDIHVDGGNSYTQKKVKSALEDLHDLRPQSDAMVVNGDLGDGLMKDYVAAQKLFRSSPHPDNLLYTIGNHEFYKAWHDQEGNWNRITFPNGDTEADALSRFLNFAGLPQVHYDRWVKDYHFIFLGSEKYRQSDPDNGEDAYLSDKQLSWLERRLAEKANSNKPIFVFLHQPLPFTVSGSEQARGVVQHERLKKILARYPQVIMFSSHTHHELKSPNTIWRGPFTVVNTSSVQEPYDARDKPLGKERSEGLSVEVYSDRVLIKGRDFHTRQWIPAAQFAVTVN